MDISTEVPELESPYSAFKQIETIATGPKSTLNYPDMYMNHILGSLAYGEHIVNTINANKKTVELLDPEFMKLCTILHDIGRPVTDYNNFDVHELYSGLLLQPNNQKIADIVQRHFTAYEKVKIVTENNMNEELSLPEDIKPDDYIQNNLLSELVTFVDLSVDDSGKYIGWAKKIDTLVEKYESLERQDPLMIDVLLNYGGLDRMKRLCEKIDKLL